MYFKKIDRFPYWFEGEPYPGMGGIPYRTRVNSVLPLVTGEFHARQPKWVRCAATRTRSRSKSTKPTA
jgi:hypothetical protein